MVKDMFVNNYILLRFSRKVEILITCEPKLLLNLKQTMLKEVKLNDGMERGTLIIN